MPKIKILILMNCLRDELANSMGLLVHHTYQGFLENEDIEVTTLPLNYFIIRYQKFLRHKFFPYKILRSKLIQNPIISKLNKALRAFGIDCFPFDRAIIKSLSRKFNQYDLILWFGTGGDTYSILLPHLLKPPIILHCNDSTYLYHSLENSLSSKYIARPLAYLIEKRLLRLPFHGYIYVGKHDFQAAKKLVDTSTQDKIHVLCNGVDTDYFHPKKIEEIKNEKLIILFAGLLNHPPNVETVTYCIEEILPSLNIPFEFRIAGKYPDPKIQQHADSIPWVNLIGEQPSLVPVYQKADLLLAPLKILTGVKNKILDSIVKLILPIR